MGIKCWSRVLLSASILTVGCSQQNPAAPGAPGSSASGGFPVGATGSLPGVAPTAANALAADRSMPAPVRRLSNQSIVDGAFSIVVRNDSGVSFTIHTSNLQPGAAYTVWAVIFNNPAGCSLPCDMNDPRTVRFVTGHVVGNGGVGNFGGHIRILDAPNDPAQIRLGDGILTNPRGAEIHFVIRGHGQPVPGLVEAQISSFGGGCNNAPPGFGPPGPNTCVDVQVSVQAP